jgi:pyruvate kinase
MDRRTKIVATLGPATDDPEVLRATLAAGVDVVRLNLSHGSVDGHVKRIAAVRELSRELQRPIAVLADLPGPKIRAGDFGDEGVQFETGSHVRLRVGNRVSTAEMIEVDYPELVEDVAAGDVVALGDGVITLRIDGVDASDGGVLSSRVESPGRTQGRPGVHLSADRVRLSSPTDLDLELARQMVDAGVDYLAVSFVRSADDIDRVREVSGDRALLVAKIETGPAVEELEAIIGTADAVMVARGDLGIDRPLADVPHLQKRIIRRCVEAGTPVITATQMLESMVQAPTPTRAEVSDVANAVFDGTDAVMLSGETAIGRDPARVIATMESICVRAEAEADYEQWAVRMGRNLNPVAGTDRVTSAVAHAASQAARDLEVDAILCCTRTGRTARAMARFRPRAPLLALSPKDTTACALSLSWGVVPIQMSDSSSTDELVWLAVETAVHAGRLQPGATVIVLAGAPDRPSTAATDVMRVVTLR